MLIINLLLINNLAYISNNSYLRNNSFCESSFFLTNNTSPLYNESGIININNNTNNYVHCLKLCTNKNFCNSFLFNKNNCTLLNLNLNNFSVKKEYNTIFGYKNNYCIKNYNSLDKEFFRIMIIIFIVSFVLVMMIAIYSLKKWNSKKKKKIYNSNSVNTPFL